MLVTYSLTTNHKVSTLGKALVMVAGGKGGYTFFMERSYTAKNVVVYRYWRPDEVILIKLNSSAIALSDILSVRNVADELFDAVPGLKDFVQNNRFQPNFENAKLIADFISGKR